MAERESKLSDVFSYKGTNPIIRTSSKSNYLPKVPFPNAINWRSGLQYINMNFAGDTVQSIAEGKTGQRGSRISHVGV